MKRQHFRIDPRQEVPRSFAIHSKLVRMNRLYGLAREQVGLDKRGIHRLPCNGVSTNRHDVAGSKTIRSQKRGACKPDPNTQATRKITNARSQGMGYPNRGLVRILMGCSRLSWKKFSVKRQSRSFPNRLAHRISLVFAPFKAFRDPGRIDWSDWDTKGLAVLKTVNSPSHNTPPSQETSRSIDTGRNPES